MNKKTRQDAIDRLDEENLIINPKRKRGGGYKYAYMTEKGREKARELLHRMNIEQNIDVQSPSSSGRG